MQWIFRLGHVKDFILDILHVQLWIQAAVHPHLVDLPQVDVYISLQAFGLLMGLHGGSFMNLYLLSWNLVLTGMMKHVVCLIATASYLKAVNSHGCPV